MLSFNWYFPSERFQRTLMLKPAFALVSMKMTFKSLDLPSPSSMDTCLQPDASKRAGMEGQW